VLHAPSVFISYSHGDKQLVIDLYNQLKNKKIKLWLDQFEVSHGDLFQQKIEQALRSSDAILTVLSRNANSSNWISFEGSYFYGQGERPIIPVVLDDEGKALADKLPFLKGRAYIDLSNPKARREGVAKLSTTLSSLRNA